MSPKGMGFVSEEILCDGASIRFRSAGQRVTGAEMTKTRG